MRIVVGDGVAQWIAARSGGVVPTGASAIGIWREQVIAGIMFENYNGSSITCHMAAEGRLSREFLWTVADYAFIQCRVNKIIAPVASNNTRMCAMLIKMGFDEEAVIADAAPDGDILIFTLRKEHCRFLGERYGKTRSTTIA